MLLLPPPSSSLPAHTLPHSEFHTTVPRSTSPVCHVRLLSVHCRQTWFRHTLLLSHLPHCLRALRTPALALPAFCLGPDLHVTSDPGTRAALHSAGDHSCDTEGQDKGACALSHKAPGQCRHPPAFSSPPSALVFLPRGSSVSSALCFLWPSLCPLREATNLPVPFPTSHWDLKCPVLVQSALA